jgi:Plasma-membrane choline transporter
MGISTGQTVQVPEKNPTLSSAKRALTTSFGSNCFGSLLIAIIQTLRVLADQARMDAQQEGESFMYIVACCLECILQIFGDILEYFNRYAFAQVAIYGKDYWSAAKDTWQLCKTRGIDAIINDSLIGNVLGVGTIVVGMLTSFAGLAYFRTFT